MPRPVTENDLYIAKARLRGLDAWNGQGTMVHLALTADNDSTRLWMEPLDELCRRVLKAPLGAEMTDEEASVMDSLAQYSAEFYAALKE